MTAKNRLITKADGMISAEDQNGMVLFIFWEDGTATCVECGDYPVIYDLASVEDVFGKYVGRVGKVPQSAIDKMCRA